MLNLMYGVLAMVPTTFGIAGYTLVSRHWAGNAINPQRAKHIDALTY
jgi:hypothetical protein